MPYAVQQPIQGMPRLHCFVRHDLNDVSVDVVGQRTGQP
jgi:hypothetical protein